MTFRFASVAFLQPIKQPQTRLRFLSENQSKQKHMKIHQPRTVYMRPEDQQASPIVSPRLCNVWKSDFTLQEIPCECRVKVHFELRDKCVTLTGVWNAQLAPLGCLRSRLRVSPALYQHVCWLPVWPQFIIYPQLIGVGVTQRNAPRPQQPINGFNFPIRCGSVQESIKEAGPLAEDNDLYWPCVCKIDFLGYNVGWMLGWVKISF